MSFDDDDVQQNPWTRPGFIAAALVVAIVVVLGIFLATRGSGNESTPPSPTTGGPTASTSPEPEPEPEPTEPAEAEGDPSVCGLDDVELEGTVTTAPDAEWTLLGTTAAPAAADVGPAASDEDGARYCYARTPAGAVMAAANIFAMSSTPELLHPLMDTLAVPGAGRDAALELTEGAASGSAPGVRVQIAGFNLLEYDGGQTATVDVAFTASNGTQGAIPYQLQWAQGDWKFELRDDGSMPFTPTQLPDLAGYVPWAGA